LRELLVEIFVSEALRSNFPPPIPFFCLNFSSQLVLFALTWLSLLPTVAAKNLAFSLIAASVSGMPCFCEFRTQLANARSMSGNLPFALFTGDKLRSSGNRYFSFCRKTFETVLRETVRESYLQLLSILWLTFSPRRTLLAQKH
jgi:hypothetical protein